jgi:hypothetical protein
VAVRPTGESLTFKRRGAGIEDLIARHSEPYHRRWLRSRLPAAAVSTAPLTLGAALDAAFAAYISIFARTNLPASAGSYSVCFCFC